MVMDRPYAQINRRKSRQIMVGDVPVGGDAPITVQSMTNTDTTDVAATLDQVNRLVDAGADIVRISTPTRDAVTAFGEIVKQVNIPLVADIHYHYQLAIEAAKVGAACLRINPGNIGSMDKVREVVKAAEDNDCAIRIGVNAGSLEKDLLDKFKEPNPEAMVESAMRHIGILEDVGFTRYKVSCKASDVFLAAAAYKLLAEQGDFPLHLGVTEAGGLRTGSVKSAMGLGNLLWSGIGDTIRVSLSADPVEEIKVGFEILKGLGLRHKGVNIVSCPSCARQNFDVIETVRQVEERIAHIQTPMTVSIIGCAVNGPGEAMHTDLGITGGKHHTHLMYNAGQLDHRAKESDVVEYLVKMIEDKATELATERAELHAA